MKTPRSLLFIASLSIGLLGLTAASVLAQTVITSLPYTITASGHYTINGNLSTTSTTGPALTVNAANVIIDLNGYYIAGPGNPALDIDDTNAVIYVGNCANVTVRNGTVAGNVCGIVFQATTAANSRNFVVDSVTVTRCYYFGVYFASAAPGSVVRNCSLSAIGNSTASTSLSPSGLFTQGGVRMENNNIGTVVATGTGSSSGIEAAAGDFEIGNTIVGCTYGIFGGTYLNNLTSGCTTPFAGGTNATGNN